MSHERIEVERLPSGSDLARKLWVFWIDYPYVVLDEYREDTRPTKRHKWRMERIYTRLESRTVLSMRRLHESDVAVPDGVLAQARAMAAERLQVCLWSGHSNGRPRKT